MRIKPRRKVFLFYYDKSELVRYTMSELFHEYLSWLTEPGNEVQREDFKQAIGPIVTEALLTLAGGKVIEPGKAH